MTSATRWAGAFWAVCLTSHAAAQPPSEPPSPDAVEPPQLLGELDPGTPDEPVTDAVTVTAAVTITAEGIVTDVAIVESGGEELDARLRRALEVARFRPAMRGGEAFAVRVRYAYTFTPPPPPPAGVLVVEVRDPMDDAPVEGAAVRLGGEEGERAVTDAEGLAAFEGLSPGTVELRVTRAEGMSVESQEEILAGEETYVLLRVAGPAPEPGTLDEDDEEGLLEFGSTATVEAPPREVTRRTISQEEMLSVAGTRGDALRAIEVFPGVARPAFGSGELIIRGAAPEDSQVFLEGTPVPLLYHFGGLTSFFQGTLLDQINFYPGNFSTRYGRRVGGVVEVDVTDARPERVRGMVDLNLIDVSAVLEAPLGERGGMAVAARRSWLDTWFGAALGGADGISLTTAPVYYDYQAIATYRPSDRDRLRLMAYGSSDTLRLLFEEPDEEDPSFRGGLGTRTQFHFVDFRWERDWNSKLQQEIALSSGWTGIAFDVGENLAFDQTQTHVNLRSEWRWRAHDRLRITTGLDSFIAPFNIDYTGPLPGQEEGNPNSVGGGITPFAGQDDVRVDTGDLAFRPALYAAADLALDPLTVIAGARADDYGSVDRWTVDPRLTMLVDVHEDAQLKLGVGTFSQAPELNQSSRELGNPMLRPIRALHLTAGGQYDPDEGIRLGVEGFYKYLWDRVVGTPDGNEPIFTNDGIGRIYGLEVSARIRPDAFGGRFFGLLSYTLSRSERRDQATDESRLFAFDQPHIFSLSGTFRLPKNWEIGGTMRLVSGNPATRVRGGVYDPNSDTYSGIPGLINNTRDPLFHRLDLRVQKNWNFADERRVSVYLDIQNVYNQMNQEGLSFNFDFTQTAPVSGLPIIPSIGFRGEL